jgi:transposase-like protein
VGKFELKPCPVCKSTQVSIKGWEGDFQQVVCQDCNYSSPEKETEELAAQAWNEMFDLINNFKLGDSQ